MFPSRTPRRLSTALLEVAEAMLRPTPGAEIGDAAGESELWQWPSDLSAGHAVRVERAPRRIPRTDRKRRPGSPAPAPQRCTNPLLTRAKRSPTPRW